MNWWFLCHHCNFKTPSTSALISVTNICQQRFFSSHLWKENSVGREVFWLDFWSYLYMPITTYSLLKARWKPMLKSKSGEVCDCLSCVGNSFLSHWLTCRIAIQLLGAQCESCRCNSSPINFHILNSCLVAVSMCRSSNCKRSYLRKSDLKWVIWALTSLRMLKSAGHNLSRRLHFRGIMSFLERHCLVII